MTNKKVYITAENVDKYFKRNDNMNTGRNLLSILDEEVTEKQFFDIMIDNEGFVKEFKDKYVFTIDYAEELIRILKDNETNK